MTDLSKSPFMHVHIELSENSLDLDVASDLGLDPDNLNESLIRHPAIYAFYSSITQQANLLAADAKFQYDKAYAEHMRLARDELQDEGTKRITDKQLTMIIESQPAILALRRKMIEADHQAHKLYSFVKALEHKKECLMQLCNNRRKEMEHLSSRVLMPNKSSLPPIGVNDEQ